MRRRTTPTSLDTLSLSEARRIALAAQGFDRPRTAGQVSLRDLSRMIGRKVVMIIAHRASKRKLIHLTQAHGVMAGGLEPAYSVAPGSR
jgi:hypothetical protein